MKTRNALKILSLLAASLTLASCEVVLDGIGFGSKEHKHSFKEMVTEEAYFASGATCVEGPRYYYSCSCGEKGEETFQAEGALGHVFDGGEFYTSDERSMVVTVRADQVAIFYTCARCGSKEGCRVDTDKDPNGNHRHYAHEYEDHGDGTHGGNCAVCKQDFSEACEHAAYSEEEAPHCHKCESAPNA